MRGLILINTGTPTAPEPQAVRNYLREFLMDPCIIGMPGPLRWLLVHGWILQTRPAASAALYRMIWTEQGSPLLVHSMALAKAVQSELGDEWLVRPAMRYGSPSIASVLAELHAVGVKEARVLPLYPQDSLATTGTSIRECKRQVGRVAPGMRLSYVSAFYDSPLFIDSFAEVTRSALASFPADYTLFSFHGLPERHDIYQAQCLATAKLLASKLGLGEAAHGVSFQSRFGRGAWLRPYTSEVIEALPQRGVRRLAVVCPAFVADCLETLEEVRLRLGQQFVRAGGEELRLVPSLNANQSWVRAVASLAKGDSVECEC